MTTSASDSTTTGAADLALLFGPQDPSVGAFPTDALVARMLDSGEGISDLVFSPGRPPQVEQHGELTPVPVTGLNPLTAITPPASPATSWPVRLRRCAPSATRARATSRTPWGIAPASASTSSASAGRLRS